MSRIIVVGAGFGALTSIRKLRTGDPALQIDVIAPKPEFVYYPGTILDPHGSAALRRWPAQGQCLLPGWRVG